MIIDRSKTQEAIASQIDVSVKEFQQLESLEEIQEEENQSYEGDGDVLTEGEKLGHPPSEMFEEDDAYGGGTTQKEAKRNGEILRS